MTLRCRPLRRDHRAGPRVTADSTMIIVYRLQEGAPGREFPVERHMVGPAESIPPSVLWIDMVEPTREEDHRVEAFLGGSVPTREDMKDIEPSELLYNENGVRYMTARLVCRAESDEPCLTGVTFILKNSSLVMVRYEEP